MISFDLVNYSAQLSLDVLFFITVPSHVYLVCFNVAAVSYAPPAGQGLMGYPVGNALRA